VDVNRIVHSNFDEYLWTFNDSVQFQLFLVFEFSR